MLKLNTKFHNLLLNSRHQINTKTFKLMKKLLLSTALLLALAVTFTSCRDEKTEVTIEDSMDNTGDAMEDAADDMEDSMEEAADDAEGAMEEAGKALDKAAKDTGDALDNAADATKDKVNDITDDN